MILSFILGCLFTLGILLSFKSEIFQVIAILSILLAYYRCNCNSKLREFIAYPNILKSKYPYFFNLPNGKQKESTCNWSKWIHWQKLGRQTH